MPEPRAGYCHVHNVDERVPRRGFQCFECGHVWTPWTLWRAWQREMRSLFTGDVIAVPYDPTPWSRHRAAWSILSALAIRPSSIPSCPECLHDF